MESYHQSISAGVVRSCPCTVDTQESHELGPQARLKLAAAVRCKGGGYSKTGNPPRQEGLCDCFRGDVGEGNGLGPPGEAVHTCKQVGVALRGG